MKYYRRYLRNVITTVQILCAFSFVNLINGCNIEPLEIPEPPSFDWTSAIYQNPVDVERVNEAPCDISPYNPPDGDRYRLIERSKEPIVWAMRLNKARIDKIAYLVYFPNLETDEYFGVGRIELKIRDLINGEEILVFDANYAGAGDRFDFAGDYLVYWGDFYLTLFNWKTKQLDRIVSGYRTDDGSISPEGDLFTYQETDFDFNRITYIKRTGSRETIFKSYDKSISGHLIWKDDSTLLHSTIGGNLKMMNLGVDDAFHQYLGPFDAGLGFLIGLSKNGRYLYGGSTGVTDLHTLKVNILWRTAIPDDCGNRELGGIFILPDNTFMMRKTYEICDHDERTYHKEIYWHLFDADASNERRVELQF